jgi:hypothetical protein
MLFGKKKPKKDKGLPDLPEYPKAMPVMSDLKKFSRPGFESPFQKETKQNLPTFPSSPANPGFAQGTIKEAVKETKKFDLPKLPDMDKPVISELGIPANQEMTIPPLRRSPKTIEMEEWTPKKAPHTIRSEKVIEDKPIYVKLDKFKNAHENLKEIKAKLAQIDDLIGTIKQAKSKEEEELAEWEREIETVKARLNTIISEIFEDNY